MKVINGKYYKLMARTKDWLIFEKTLSDQDPELVLVKKCRYLYPNGDAVYYDVSLCKNRESTSHSCRKQGKRSESKPLKKRSLTIVIEQIASQSDDHCSFTSVQSLASVNKVQA